MRLTRIHVPAALHSDAELVLPKNASDHLVRVLRLRAGAALLIFDGQGHEHHAEISRIAGQRVSVHIGNQVHGVSESSLHITLVQGISRGERMDWTLQKATELGVSSIAPVITERGVVRLDEKQAEKKQTHWQGVVSSACEQSGRSVVPAVQTPLHLRSYLSGGAQAGMRVVLSPTAPASLAGLASLSNQVELLIGPEGGLADEELLLAEKSGFKPVRLGPRVLRTETASVVALSVLQALWGDLR